MSASNGRRSTSAGAVPGVSRRTALAAGLAVGIGALAGVGASSAPTASGLAAGTALPFWARTPTPWWNGLSPQQQAGQRVIFSYPGLTPPQSLLDGIAAGTVGGVIFFGENIASPAQLNGVCAQLRAAQASSPVREPLLLMTDQEGGEVRRLQGAQPQLSEKQIGASATPDALASAAGAGAAASMAEAGMNLNLAPVLDVFRTPGDFDDQWGRSYSSDPAVAGRLGAEFVTAQQSAGVFATAKHFPGLGTASADQNTDEEPVTLGVPLAQLQGVDEAAFVPAIAAGVQLVMTSWAIYPALDAVNPAGLSPAVVQGELRGRLGFAGVTITDAFEAGALEHLGGTGPVAVLAAKAGMDLLLCSARDVSQGADAVAALATALTGGAVPSAEHTAALHRLQILRVSAA